VVFSKSKKTQYSLTKLPNKLQKLYANMVNGTNVRLRGSTQDWANLERVTNYHVRKCDIQNPCTTQIMCFYEGEGHWIEIDKELLNNTSTRNWIWIFTFHITSMNVRHMPLTSWKITRASTFTKPIMTSQLIFIRV
jgi:hypothetical protein